MKVNVVFHPENSTVSYDQMKYWYFDAEHSNGTLNDRVIALNTVAVVSTIDVIINSNK